MLRTAAAQETHFDRHGEYALGRCDEIDGASVPDTQTCITALGLDGFTVTATDAREGGVTCTWHTRDQDGTAGFDCHRGS